MEMNVLYYPTVAIPNGSWLRQALLFSNRISSIVPERWDWSFQERDLMYSFLVKDDIEFLEAERQYRAIHPDEFVSEDSKLLTSFKKEFFELIKSPGFQNFLCPPQEFTFRSKLHIDKINPTNHEMLEFLRKRGYIQELTMDDAGFRYYPTEEKISDLYMSLLAKYLTIDEEILTPSTDTQTYFQFNYEPLRKARVFPCTNILFNNILPVPRDEVPLDVIIDFKHSNRELLYKFQNLIRDFENDVAQSENWIKTRGIAQRYRDQINQQLNELKKELHDTNIHFITASLLSLIKTSFHMFASLSSPPVSFGIGGVGTIELMLLYYDTRNRELEKKLHSTVGYLYEAHKDEII